MRSFRHPTRCPDKHGFVDLHSSIEVLPVDRYDLRAVAPVFEDVHVAGVYTKAFGVDASEVTRCVVNEGG